MVSRACAVVLILSLLVLQIPPIHAQVTVPGDVDGNGDLELADARLLVSYVVGKTTGLPNPGVADVTQDGEIRVDDALAIAQRVTGQSRIVMAHGQYGASTSTFAGDVVRIGVFERFMPFNVTGGTARVVSASTGYDSGEMQLVFERDGRSLYCLWNTSGMDPAVDYQIYVNLTEASTSPSPVYSRYLTAEELSEPSTAVSLSGRVFEVRHLEVAVDASCPTPGIPLEFRRVIPNDTYHAPYIGPLGIGWTHNFNAHLVEETDGRVTFFGPNGFNRYFASNADGTYTAEPRDHAVLTRDVDGTFVLREKTGLLYRFRSDLLLDFVEDTNGNRISCVYDGANHLIEIAHSCGEAFTLEYDDAGRISRVTDQVGRTTNYAYWQAYLTTVTDPGSGTTLYTYDSDRLISIQQPDDTYVHFTYDGEGRMESYSGTWGAGLITFTYDEDGTTYLTDGFGAVTTISVNENGQPTAVVNPGGAIALFEYDVEGNLALITDPLGRTWELSYDSQGNATTMRDSLGNQTHLAYEPTFSRLVSLEDALGRVTSFGCDGAGNVVQIVYPDGSAEGFDYGGQGLLQSKTDRNGDMIIYAYDSRGLLLSKTYPDELTATYTYDSAGNMTGATNYAGTITYTYDAMDHMASVTYPGSRTFSYVYDIAGKRTQMIDPDGRVISYEYDVAGRLAALRDGAGSLLAGFEYDGLGRRLRKTLGNGCYATYEYDTVGHLTHLLNWAPDDIVISRFDYTYDAAGNRTSKGMMEGIESHTYDPSNQLLGVTYPDGSTEGFVYDALGNRLTVTHDGTPTTYTVNELNQYTAVGSTTYTYDANGNMTSKTEGGETTTYEYEYENRLIRVTTPTETIEYAYDAFGLRCARTGAGGTVWYLRDGFQDVIEEDDSNTTLARYVWSDVLDEAVRMDRGGSAYYYTQDALMSVYDLLDSSGLQAEHYGYTAFGHPLASSATGNPWLFTGLAYDFATGLQYNRHRYYAPFAGRFSGADPLGLAAGPNLYEYTGNVPTLYRDPTGEYFWYGAIIGGTTAVVAHHGVTACASSPGNVAAGYAGAFVGGAIAGFFFPWNADLQIVAGALGSMIADMIVDSIEDLGGGGGSGGVCPTFVQVPRGVEAVPATQPDPTGDQLGARIAVPVSRALLRSDIPIFGVAGGTEFSEYRVEYGEGANPTEWHLIDSSTTPQPTCDVGLEEMAQMQGTLDIRGNLATWNVGLRNWEHLPWHPTEDSTDLNGVYTIRLVVEGTDGQTVEDRVTCEVGRVIAQCLPGEAVSSDGRVTMQFPEQALTAPFRVYTILPLESVGEAAPPAPAGCEVIGPAYRIREPGDRFAKDVTLAFAPGTAELIGQDAKHVGICRYDIAARKWLWLDTVHAADAGRFSTVLTELPTPEAIYGLVIDPSSTRRSHAPTLAAQLEPLKPAAPGVLVRDTFEDGLGRWKSRDRLVGSSISRDNQVTPDGTYCLQIVNDSFGGSFSCTVLDQPFDIREYPVMSFDYRVPTGTKTDFYLLVGGRWYNLGFADDPMNFRNADVNIAGLGCIPDVQADNRWHSASINLYDLLRQKTRNTQVDAVVMADWDVPAYMKLDFGRNIRGATYYIDNFSISAQAAATAPEVMAVDSFDGAAGRNEFGGTSGVFSKPGTELCQAIIVTAAHEGEVGASTNKALELTYDTSLPGTYCGYWTALMAADLEGMGELSFRVRGSSPVPPLMVGLRHCKGPEARVALRPYLTTPGDDGWQAATIPLSAFQGLPDLSLVDSVFFTFENELRSGKGTVVVDDLRFDSHQSFGRAVDASVPGDRNLLGGTFRIMENGAAAVSASRHRDRWAGGTATDCYRISYGGNIGLDYGEQGFSYGVWETDLLGLDASSCKHLVLKVRGEKAGETPNIYLDDGTTRRCLRAGVDFPALTSEWQEIRLPLSAFAKRSPFGVDLGHLVALQIVFEWVPMSGTIYVSEIRFE